MIAPSPKALMLSYWNVSDPAFGGGRRINALLQALAGRVVLCQPGGRHAACETVTYACDFGRKKRGINWGMFNFLWPANARLARRLVRRHRPPVIIMTSMWNYFPLQSLRGIPIVLDAHDVNAVAIGERFGVRHPFTRLVRAWEARVVRRVDHLFVCSPQDRELFLALYGLDPRKVTVVPNGVNLRQHADAPTSAGGAVGAPTTLFFMGKLDYQPNREALEFLSGTVMPALERGASGRFRLLVCGGPVPAGPFHPAIAFTGVVPTEQLVRHLQQADLCLAPIFTGGGTRVKILEYMASGKPVVATPKGAEGLGCTSGQELVLAETENFSAAVLALAQDPARARALGAAGLEFVRRGYDYAASIAPLWLQVLDRWLDVPSVSSSSSSSSN